MSIIGAFKRAFEGKEAKRTRAIQNYFDSLPMVENMPLERVNLSDDKSCIVVSFFAFSGHNIDLAQKAVQNATGNTQDFETTAYYFQTEIDDLIRVSVTPKTPLPEHDLQAVATQINASLHTTYGKRPDGPIVSP